MDRTRTRSRLLIAAGLGAAALAMAPGASAPPLHALRWLPSGADAARILTRQPGECLALPRDPEAAYRVEVGRAAFRTPLLLGGQAARAGIGCVSCHRNGRNNPDFAFPGVSGSPGTADVTASLFSAHRGDDIFDPRPIPDLGGPRDRLKVSRDPASPALRTFITGLVTEEFDGDPPPAAVLDGLAAYIRALSPAACAPGPDQPIRVAGALEDVRRAVRAGQGALRRGDPATAVVMLESARSQLGDIAERYDAPDLGDARASLSLADLDLAAAKAAIERREARTQDRLAAWLARSALWTKGVEAEEPRSLYNEAVLARRLSGRGRS